MCRGALFALVLVVGQASAATALSNGDFGAGLDHWATTGPVSVDAGELVLADDGPSESAAWQAVGTLASRTRIEFDVLPSLSDHVPAEPFGFPDLFAVSLHLFDDAAGFSPGAATTLSAHPVVSFDHLGHFDVGAGGTIAAAARGGDWLHVAIELDTPHAWLAPAFELFELGFVGGDSTVRIDDVVITPVPEPGTALLVGLGLLALAGSRRRA